jgi:hypothetical protein
MASMEMIMSFTDKPPRRPHKKRTPEELARMPEKARNDILRSRSNRKKRRMALQAQREAPLVSLGERDQLLPPAASATSSDPVEDLRTLIRLVSANAAQLDPSARTAAHPELRELLQLFPSLQ